MARRAMCEEIGLLDERFFNYWEEVEWCLRAVRRGWRVVHVPAARAWHRDPRPVPAEASYYVTRNRLLALAAQRPPLGTWLRVTANLAATLLSWSVRPKWRHLRPHRTAMWHGVLDFARGRVGKRR
jgi:GT2 family glycosyltransferase